MHFFDSDWILEASVKYAKNIFLSLSEYREEESKRFKNIFTLILLYSVGQDLFE
jgi:hypothetical protein